MDRSAGGRKVSAMATGRREGYLLAVLLNPPSSSSGARSLGAVRRAAAVLGFDGFRIANLFAEPTATVVELNALTVPGDSWAEVQQRLMKQLPAAGGVLAAWGVAGASGRLRNLRDARAAWLVAEACRCGHDAIWTVGGQPRHPSRWHQYVADKHGRTSGGSFEKRLGQVLELIPLTDYGCTRVR